MSAATEKTFYRGGMMDLTDYRLETAAFDDRWDAFVQRSPQGTLFCLSDFVTALDGTFLPYWVLKKEEPKAALLLWQTGPRRTELHELVIHNGPMMTPRDGQQNGAQIMSEEFRVLSFVAAQLEEDFDAVSLATHPDLQDLRPFLWHNYGTDGPTYDCELRYTAYLDIAGANRDGDLNDNPVYLRANKSRRQEIRYAVRDGVRTERHFDPEMFARFYEAVFERQGLTPEPATAEIGSAIEALEAAGRLRMFVSETATGTPGSFAVFGLDDRRAYYLYGANDPAVRDGHTGTAVLWDAFRSLAEETGEVDLEGVNSPMRGYFKLSFGADLRPYYHLRLSQ